MFWLLTWDKTDFVLYPSTLDHPSTLPRPLPTCHAPAVTPVVDSCSRWTKIPNAETAFLFMCMMMCLPWWATYIHILYTWSHVGIQKAHDARIIFIIIIVRVISLATKPKLVYIIKCHRYVYLWFVTILMTTNARVLLSLSHSHIDE